MDIAKVRWLIREQAKYIYFLVKVSDNSTLLIPEASEVALVMLEAVRDSNIDASYDPESMTIYIGRE